MARWISAALLLWAGIILLHIGAAQSHGGSHDDDADADAAAADHDLRDKGLILTKVWCLIIAFVATFLSGISPYFFRWHSSFLVLGTQFAGGVFLGTALMHFLSDANETFEERTSKSYPFAYMLATAGYLLTMLGDCIISSVYSRTDASRHHADPAKLRDAEAATATAEKGDDLTKEGSTVEDNTLNMKNIVTAPAIVKEASFGDSLLLIIALCFHSVFEGIAIGIAGKLRDAWRNLWTICLHKLFAAIAMGIALLKIMPNRPLLSTSLYSFAFAISTPIGVAIGIIIDSTTQGAAADWIYAISMGIACGVFVYVAINHLLAKGFVPDRASFWDTPFYRFLAVVLGAAVIAVVMIWD
ncbi:hypothetical protein SELMODRAFT_269005 [Selaginella moellendorffii]|uniref:ZIP family transporter n=1 Tax=Selaginella moellendorffii TaxID=88036 RepID=D8SQ63_SELML|nr:hypothetical protein SELMODRAFT_269005 [Selaginella moellendorffii]